LWTVTKKATLFDTLRRKDGSGGLSRRKLPNQNTYAVRDPRKWGHSEGCPGHNKGLALSDAFFAARSRQPGQKRAGASRADPVISEPRKSPARTHDSRNLAGSDNLQNMSGRSRGVPCRSSGGCQRHAYCQIPGYLAPRRTCEDQRAPTRYGHDAALLTGRSSAYACRLRNLRDASIGLARLS